MDYYRGTEKLLTAEQRAVVACNAHTIVVQAYAGTGKTTTLMAYAKQRPHHRFTYICFNKAIQLDALKRCPQNVTCVTFDALAYHRYSNEALKTGRVIIEPLNKHFVTTCLKGKRLCDGQGKPFHLSSDAAQTIANVLSCFSSDNDHGNVHACHVSSILPTKYGERMKNYIVQLAQWLWQQYRKRALTLACHTLNRKLLWLEGLTRDIDAKQILLIDEAQDLNPLMMAALQRAPHRRLLVGDVYQRIYGSLMGSQNAMRSSNRSVRFQLTQSFRFGHDVAHMLTRFLRILQHGSENKSNNNVKILGTGKRSTHIAKNIDVMTTPFTALFRTNLELFKRALVYAKGKMLIHIKGWRSLRKQICDAEKFERSNGNTTVELVESEKDVKNVLQQRQAYSKIVDAYKNRLANTIALIDQQHVDKEQEADVVCSTIHKFKGLEANRIWVHDDIHLKADFHQHKWEEHEREEARLVYVAMSRAKHVLRVDWDIQQYIKDCEYILKRGGGVVMPERLKDPKIQIKHEGQRTRIVRLSASRKR